MAGLVSHDDATAPGRPRAAPPQSLRKRTRSSRERKWRIRRSSWRGRSVGFLVGIETRGFFEEDFFDPFSSSPADGDGEAWHLETRSGRRQIPEPVKDETTNRIESVRLELKAKMLAEVVEARVAADEK